MLTIGGPEPGHFQEVSCDRFSLAPFLSADARVGAGRINQCDDREAELLGQLHAAEGFAVSLRVRQAKIAADLFLGIAAFMVADEHDLMSAHPRQPATYGGIVAEAAVAMHFAEIAAA